MILIQGGKNQNWCDEEEKKSTSSFYVKETYQKKINISIDFYDLHSVEEKRNLCDYRK